MTQVLVITGEPGAGKTTLMGMFQGHGLPVLSADQVVHTLLAENIEVIAALGQAFPALLVDNSLDLNAYRAHFFNNPEHLSWVEKILHPPVYDYLGKFVAQYKEAGASLVLLEIPLYFESPPSCLPVDKVLLAWAPLPLRQERVLARAHMTLERFKCLRARQLPFQQKAQQADFIVDTRASLETLEVEVQHMIKSMSSMV